ncbi:WhiB family transcriptional regulator [Ornithinimicrobium pratense]
MTEAMSQPGPLAELWEWQFQGLCRTTSPEVFFHPEGERGPARRRRDQRAKELCAACPVLEQCRTHALAVREPYGVWGGMSEEERAAHYAEVDRNRTR